ncbi:MAG: hypothetical protein U0821_17850 [Chloroflexota bacterium]
MAISRETLAVAAACLGLLGLYVWSTKYWLDLSDEGYFVYLSSRVLNGDLPYRDFDTYYTPGVFYLYSATMWLFGVTVMPVRILLAVVRVATAALTYRLCRRLVPWPYAWVPFLLVALVEPSPVFPEPHPAWFGMLFTLLTMEMLAHHESSGRRVWIVAAGAAAGLTFAFKQNVGAFAALGVGAYVLLGPRSAPGGWAVRAAALGYSLLLPVAALVLIWPAINALVFAVFVIPLAVTVALAALARPRTGRGAVLSDGLGSVLGDGVVAAAAFFLTTLAWLGPLATALGLSATPFGLFVGAVNQNGLILPLEPLPPGATLAGLTATWLCVVVWAVGCAGRRGGPRATTVLAWAVLISGVLLVTPVRYSVRDPIVEDPELYPWLTFLDLTFGTSYLYLPAISAMAACVFGGISLWRGAVPPFLVSYLLMGSLAALAMYPRVDLLHAMFAGVPLFVVGAYAMSRVERLLVGGRGVAIRTGVFVALLIFPVAATLPHLHWRVVTVLWPDPRSAVQPPYVAVGLPRAPVIMPRNSADSVREAVEYVQRRSDRSEYFFVYPVAPLFNFLADRPNPTRFDHFIPGALTHEDMAEVVRDLERRKPRYVLWDHNGAEYWKTYPTNAPISDYIWRCYRQVTSFTPYLILERIGADCGP